ncbi:unnamed protein product [Diamesa serratosioi]
MLDAMNLESSPSDGPNRNGKTIKLPFLEQGFQLNFQPKNEGDVGTNIGDGGSGIVGIVETQRDNWYKKEMGLFKKISCEKTDLKSSTIENAVKIKICGVMEKDLRE